MGPDSRLPMMSEVNMNFMVIQVGRPLKEGQEGVCQVPLEVVPGSRTPGRGSGTPKPGKMRTLVLLVLFVSFATAISEYINTVI